VFTWVEEVTTSNFKVCLVEGGIGSSGNVTVNWMAYQGIESGVTDGSVRFYAWTTGTQCRNIALSKVSVSAYIKKFKIFSDLFLLRLYFIFFNAIIFVVVVVVFCFCFLFVCLFVCLLTGCGILIALSREKYLLTGKINHLNTHVFLLFSIHEVYLQSTWISTLFGVFFVAFIDHFWRHLPFDIVCF